MDFPSFNHHHHHHNRYIPPPPPPEPYPHHHHHFIQSVNHHHHPPPIPYPHPHPPPPPPVLPPPPPPPQSYNNPNFTFFNRSSPPRVSTRFDYRTDFRSDPNLFHFPQSDTYYNPHATDHVFSSSTRFLDNNNNNNNDIVSTNIDSYASVRSGLNVDKSTGAIARVMDDYVEKYEPRYVPVSENDRIWKQYGDGDTKWKKNELGDYEGESSKFSRVREGREEFKQVQKKSVLLRIGKPNGSNKKHSSKGYVVESNGISHRGKDKVKDRDRDRDSLFTEQKIEGDRERSPVDLDVSFKSNALVAKPVVTPSSPMSDDNYTHTRNRKIKRVNEFDSPLSKFSERSRRSRSSSRGFDSPSSSEKAPKQEARKDNVSNEDKSSLSGPVLDQGDGNGGSKGQPLSFRLKKKRKLINPASRSFNFQLAVKDNNDKGESLKDIVAAPISGAIPFPTLEEIATSKVDKSPQAIVKGESLKNIPVAPISGATPFPTLEETASSKADKSHQAIDKGENLKVIPVAPISGVILYPTQEEIVSSKVDKSPQAIVLEKDGLEVANSNLHCINSFGDYCTEHKNITAENVSITNDGLLNDLNKQPCGNEILVNLENGTENISTDVKLSLGGTDTSAATSGYDQIEIPKGSTESNAGFDVVDVSNSLCDESVKIQDMSTSADMNPLDSCSDEVIIVSPEKSDDEGFLDDVSRKENESPLFEGTSNQISFNGSSELSEDVLKESTHTDIFAEDIATQSSLHKERSFTEMVTLIPTSVQTPSPDHRELSTDSKDDLPRTTGIVSTFANDADAFVTDSNGKSGEFRSDIPTSIFSSEKVSSFVDSQMPISKSTDKSISDLDISENDDNIFVKSVSKDALLNAPETGIKTSQREVTNTVLSVSQGSSVKTLDSNTNLQGSNLPLKKPSSVPAVPRVLAARSSPVFTNSRINKTVNSTTKPRTWHRSSSTPAPVPLPPKQIAAAAGQNSYIRSGNSLVRKGAPVTASASRSSVYQLNTSGPIEARNNAGSGNKVNNTYSRVASASVVRPKTPPLSGSTKLPDCPTYSRDLSSSPLELLPASPVEGNYVEQKVSEDQIHSSSNSESQKVEDEVVTGKKIQYVKRKSNQLVAASCSDQSVQDLDKTQASASSDSYYKRRKNQLIRTAAGDDLANTDVGKASKNSNKRQSGKVWTLNSQSLGKDGVLLRQKLRPQLFPWKRSRNWVNLMNLSASISNSSSLSSISRKLLLSRKRETIYTRSKHGFSLRMSKLLSVGGSSLKWSKSIERNSKRTNEAATLAVAAAQKNKREQHGTASATAELKSRNNMSRVRIFRIGSVRYKMDSSRRTLQRISDEEPSNSMQSKEEIRKSYVPKRLKIGHDEYVRIGTGNQLVRNPKRRTRVFANEKVRWSLHTARTRLAKKKKFCQFFTRFGKCNKDDGKCPYIHDSSKIAVCTKFLNGLCSNANCKLTHKVIPERMQDCSYFLQGLCSNNHCPYRHVNVNPTASVCEGFLKGYCADGNECRKKHSYACPIFEATGACPQGTKCKLHHPKNQLKRKQQSSTEQQQKNSRGRYFGSFRAEEAMRVSEKHYLKNDEMDDEVDGDTLCQEGKFAEYISLDIGNEEAGEVTGDSRTSLMISEPFGLDAGELDELTKPIRIMNRVVLGSPSECDMGVS